LDEEILQSHTTVYRHDFDHDDEEEEAEVPVVVSSNKAKTFMTGLRQFVEQSEIDEEKCDVIFKAINTLNNSFDQIEANKLSQKKFYLNKYIFLR